VGRNDIPTPSDDQRRGTEKKEEITLSIKCPSADQGTTSKGTWSDKRESAEEKKIERETCPLANRKNE
jgi:hypothetical protein